MNILQFIETGGPGGAEQVVLQLAKLLASRGTNVTIATLRQGWLTEALREANIRHIQIASGGKYDVGLPLRLAQLIRREHFDLVHSHLLDSNFYAAIASRLAGVPHVATEHGDVHHPDSKKYLALKLWLIRVLGSSVTAVSESTSNVLRERGFRQVQLIGNPIGSPSINLEMRAKIRADLGLSIDDATWVWLNVANLRPVKDHVTLLRAIDFARKRTTRPQLLVVLGDGPERDQLEALTRSLGLEKHVRLLGFCQSVGDYLQAADGFVLSSLSEALPMALLEASAFGLAVVATQVGGIPELIAHNISGLLVPPGRPDLLAQAMIDICEHPQEAHRMGEALRESTMRRFGEQTVIDQYLGLYRDLLPGNG